MSDDLKDSIWFIALIAIAVTICFHFALRKVNYDIMDLKSQIIALSKAGIKCDHHWVQYSFLPKNIWWCDKCKTWGETTPKKKGAK